jgi:hypothetical protein
MFRRGYFFLYSTLVFLLSSFHTPSLPDSFNILIERASLNFSLPKGYTEAIVTPNTQLNYDYAVKYPASNVEIRYLVQPMDELIAAYEEKERHKSPGEINIHPNKSYFVGLQAILYNLAGGKHVVINEPGQVISKAQYNADWTANAWLEPVGEFANGYSFCKVIAIHKDNIADAYYFYLTKSKTTCIDIINQTSFAMKFK